MEPPCTAPRQEISPGPRDPPTSCVELIQGFSRKVARVAAADLRCSTAALYQSKWTQFLGWGNRWGVDPCKTTIVVIAEFFLYLCQEQAWSNYIFHSQLQLQLLFQIFNYNYNYFFRFSITITITDSLH